MYNTWGSTEGGRLYVNPSGCDGCINQYTNMICDKGVPHKTVETELAVVQSSGQCALAVESFAECSSTALSLGLASTHAVDDGQVAVGLDLGSLHVLCKNVFP